MILLETPQGAAYTTDDGSTEYVRIVGSDLSRSEYPTNVLMIQRPCGGLRVVSEDRLRSQW